MPMNQPDPTADDLKSSGILSYELTNRRSGAFAHEFGRRSSPSLLRSGASAMSSSRERVNCHERSNVVRYLVVFRSADWPHVLINPEAR